VMVALRGLSIPVGKNFAMTWKMGWFRLIKVISF
jgi:hypothetical protein